MHSGQGQGHGFGLDALGKVLNVPSYAPLSSSAPTVPRQPAYGYGSINAARRGSDTERDWRYDSDLVDDIGYTQDHDEDDDYDEDDSKDLLMRPTSRLRKKLVLRSKQSFRRQPRRRRMSFSCLCNEFKISELKTKLIDDRRKGREVLALQLQHWKTILKGDVLHIYTDATVPRTRMDNEASACKDIFVFIYGCVVFWGCSVEEENVFYEKLKEFMIAEVSQSEFDESNDDMAYVYVGNDEEPDSFKIKLMATRTPNIADVIENGEGGLSWTAKEASSAEEKLALSYALAQSAKLSVFEDRCQRKIDEYKHIPEALAKHGRINMSQKTLSRMVGDLFVQRNEINLHSDVLDTPDYFWEDDKYELAYQQVWKYLDIEKRVEILNQRLNMMRELLEVIEHQMDSAHGISLEWIVIWLIVIEVVLDVIEIFLAKLGWYEKQWGEP